MMASNHTLLIIIAGLLGAILLVSVWHERRVSKMSRQTHVHIEQEQWNQHEQKFNCLAQAPDKGEVSYRAWARQCVTDARKGEAFEPPKEPTEGEQ